MRRETSANPFGVYHSNGEGSETCFSHFRSGTGKLVARCQFKRKVKSRLRCCATFSFRREKVLPEHGDLRYFLEMRADRVRRERVAQTKLSEAEDHTRRLLEEPKDYLLSEAQLELDKQELRDQCADRALHESGMPLQSQRMEVYQANHSQREKSWPHTELDREERLLPEDRMRSLQEIQELKNVLYRS